MHGDERGGELGFPTANLLLPVVQQLPGDGVYSGATSIAGTWYPAAISVGTRPQFYEAGDLMVEVHILGFRGDLYDSTLDVAFLERLRNQAKFANVAELTAQIDRDVIETQQIFEKFTLEETKLLR
jgi:riboflavin kinase/FMN adenylyltransferase